MNPFGRRTPCGEYEFPFHMELDNPQNVADVENYAAMKSAAGAAVEWVHILVRPRNGIEVPAQAHIEAGKVNGVYFPDGTISEWGNRALGAVDYACHEWERIAAQQQQQQRPPVPPPPINQVRRIAPNPGQTSARTPSPKQFWPFSWVIATAIICVIAIVAAAIMAGSKKDANAGRRDISAARDSQNTDSHVGKTPPEDAEPEVKPPAGKKAEDETNGKTNPDLVENAPARPNPAKADENEKVVVTPKAKPQNTESPNEAKPVAMNQVGDLGVFISKCQRTLDPAIRCFGWLISEANQPGDLEFEGGSTAIDNQGNEPDSVGVTFGRNWQSTLIQGQPAKFVLLIQDKSLGTSKTVSFKLHLRWKNDKGFFPVNNIPVS